MRHVVHGGTWRKAPQSTREGVGKLALHAVHFGPTLDRTLRTHHLPLLTIPGISVFRSTTPRIGDQVQAPDKQGGLTDRSAARIELHPPKLITVSDSLERDLFEPGGGVSKSIDDNLIVRASPPLTVTGGEAYSRNSSVTLIGLFPLGGRGSGIIIPTSRCNTSC